MANEYKGKYYFLPYMAENAKARDTYTPEQMKIAETIAYQQLPDYLKGRNSQMRVEQNLAKTAEALFGKPQEAAPAPPPPPPAPAAPPPPPAPSQLQIQYDTYRQQADKALAEAQAKAARLESEEYQRQQAAELQNRLAIQSQASKERGAAAATLKIAPDSQTSQTAGTSAFKRRRDQTTLAPIQSTAGINAPARSVLNV